MDVPFTHGMLIPESGGAVTFQYNPAHISRDKKTRFIKASVAGREQPYLQYGCGDAQHWNFEIQIGRLGNEESYVTDSVDALFKLMEPTVKGAGVDRPPTCQFIMGDFATVKVFVEHVGSVYGVLYDPGSLHPKQAKVKIGLVTVK